MTCYVIKYIQIIYSEIDLFVGFILIMTLQIIWQKFNDIVYDICRTLSTP